MSDYKAYGYHCAALPGDGSNDLGNVYDYLFRRHDCPLEEKTVRGILMPPAGPIEKAFATQMEEQMWEARG